MLDLPTWTQEEGRVAIVHDWMTGMRGGEAILDALCELFPRADLHTLLWTDKEMSPSILNGRRVFTSYLQGFMRARIFSEGYRKLLPLFPHAASTLDLSSYDLVISNSHCVVKGVSRLKPSALHLSFISTPMRYVWDMFDEYFGPGKCDLVTRAAALSVRTSLQNWDRRSNDRVQLFMANSTFVRQRIRDFWSRDAEVLHPFVQLNRFKIGEQVGDYYLVVSALAPYKRIDMAVEAFASLGLPLKVLGKGQDYQKLRAMAPANVEFLGGLTNADVERLYQGAKALIFPGIEDFGITPLESMASGRPVIAYKKGGVLDTVTSETGILYEDYSPEGLANAVKQMEGGRFVFSSQKCRLQAEQFSRERFKNRFVHLLSEEIKKKMPA